MNPVRRAVLLLGLSVSVSASPLAADENGRTGWTRGLSVDVYGGWSHVSSTDLDIQGRAEEQWHANRRLQGWDTTHSLDARFAYSAVGERELSFAPLGDPVAAGLRLRRDMGKAIAVSVGLEYVVRDRVTDIDQSYRISDGRPNLRAYPSEYTVQVRYPDYLVSVRAWAPALGFHVTQPLGRLGDLSLSVAGGPFFVRSRLVDESYVRTTYATGYWSESQSLREMEGKGSGWALDFGAQLRIGHLGPLALILEGGYAFRRSGPIDGSLRSEQRSVDSNAATDVSSGSSDGVWQVSTGRYTLPWGQYGEETLGVRSNVTSRDFVLDLSGLQLRAGVSLSLGRRSR